MMMVVMMMRITMMMKVMIIMMMVIWIIIHHNYLYQSNSHISFILCTQQRLHHQSSDITLSSHISSENDLYRSCRVPPESIVYQFNSHQLSDDHHKETHYNVYQFNSHQLSDDHHKVTLYNVHHLNSHQLSDDLHIETHNYLRWLQRLHKRWNVLSVGSFSS